MDTGRPSINYNHVQPRYSSLLPPVIAKSQHFRGQDFSTKPPISPRIVDPFYENMYQLQKRFSIERSIFQMLKNQEEETNSKIVKEEQEERQKKNLTELKEKQVAQMRKSELMKEPSNSSLIRDGDKRKSVLAKLQTFKISDGEQESIMFVYFCLKNQIFQYSSPSKFALLETESPMKSQLKDSTNEGSELGFDTNRIRVKRQKKEESTERENDTHFASIEKRKFDPKSRFNIRYDKSSKKSQKFYMSNQSPERVVLSSPTNQSKSPENKRKEVTINIIETLDTFIMQEDLSPPIKPLAPIKTVTKRKFPLAKSHIFKPGEDKKILCVYDIQHLKESLPTIESKQTISSTGPDKADILLQRKMKILSQMEQKQREMQIKGQNRLLRDSIKNLQPKIHTQDGVGFSTQPQHNPIIVPTLPLYNMFDTSSKQSIINSSSLLSPLSVEAISFKRQSILDKLNGTTIDHHKTQGIDKYTNNLRYEPKPIVTHPFIIPAPEQSTIRDSRDIKPFLNANKSVKKEKLLPMIHIQDISLCGNLSSIKKSSYKIINRSNPHVLKIDKSV